LAGLTGDWIGGCVSAKRKGGKGAGKVVETWPQIATQIMNGGDRGVGRGRKCLSKWEKGKVFWGGRGRGKRLEGGTEFFRKQSKGGAKGGGWGRVKKGKISKNHGREGKEMEEGT